MLLMSDIFDDSSCLITRKFLANEYKKKKQISDNHSLLYYLLIVDFYLDPNSRIFAHVEGNGAEGIDLTLRTAIGE